MKRLTNILFLAFLLHAMLFYTQNSFKTDSLKINKSRLSIVSFGQLTAIGASGFGLHSLWYSNNPSSKFHLFNDFGNWNNMDKIGHLYSSYQLSKVGPDGDLTRKQAQLEFELVEKFKSAVNAVAISKGFDLIIDGSQASLYTKPTIDLTDDVLYELRKTDEATE